MRSGRVRAPHAPVNALVGALSYTWPPFVLVAGLLLIGRVAAADNLFESVGSRLAAAPLGSLGLFVAMMLLVAAVTVVLNLDTSVVFLTPIVLHTARRRGIDERPFCYGVIFMSNAASLLLPGSNLTNLLVISSRHLSGARFAMAMFPAWALVVAATIATVAIWCRHELARPGTERQAPVRMRLGLGLVGVVGATGLVLGMADPAPYVFGVGAVLFMLAAGPAARLHALRALRATHFEVLAGLFVIAVSAGVVARVWDGPHRLMLSAGRIATAAIAAGTANLVNNLPATVLYASQRPSHPEALLVGLDIGPNLAVFGAMSSLLWLRIARSEGGNPSAVTFSRVGVVLVPISIALALAATRYAGFSNI